MKSDGFKIDYDPTLVWIANPKKIHIEPTTETKAQKAPTATTKNLPPQTKPLVSVAEKSFSPLPNLPPPPPFHYPPPPASNASSPNLYRSLQSPRMQQPQTPQMIPPQRADSSMDWLFSPTTSYVQQEQQQQSLPSKPFTNFPMFQTNQNYSQSQSQVMPKKQTDYNPWSYNDNPFACYRKRTPTFTTNDMSAYYSPQPLQPQPPQSQSPYQPYAHPQQSQPQPQPSQSAYSSTTQQQQPKPLPSDEHGITPNQHVFRAYWLTKARRLYKKYPKEFPFQYTEQHTSDEISTAVQQFEVDLRLQNHSKERRRRYTMYAAIAEIFFRMTPFGFDFTNFKKDLDKAIAEEEHYLEDEFYQLTPAEKIPSPSKEIALIIILQVLQRFLSRKQNDQQSRPMMGGGGMPGAQDQSYSGVNNPQQPIFRTGGAGGGGAGGQSTGSSPLTGIVDMLGLGQNKYVSAGISMVQSLFPSTQPQQQPSYTTSMQAPQQQQQPQYVSMQPQTQAPATLPSSSKRLTTSKITFEDLEKSNQEIKDIFDVFDPFYAAPPPPPPPPSSLSVPAPAISIPFLPIVPPVAQSQPTQPTMHQSPILKTQIPTLRSLSPTTMKSPTTTTTTEISLPDPPMGEEDWDVPFDQATDGETLDCISVA